MTVPGLWFFLKTEKRKPMNTDANFWGRREELYFSMHVDGGEKAHLKHVNIQQNLFPFTHSSSPASTGETLCSRFWVGRKCPQCLLFQAICAQRCSQQNQWDWCCYESSSEAGYFSSDDDTEIRKKSHFFFLHKREWQLHFVLCLSFSTALL